MYQIVINYVAITSTKAVVHFQSLVPHPHIYFVWHVRMWNNYIKVNPQNNFEFLSVFYMQLLWQVFLRIASQWARYYYYPQFLDKKTGLERATAVTAKNRVETQTHIYLNPNL